MHPRYQSKLLQLCLLSTVFMFTVLRELLLAHLHFSRCGTRHTESENCKHLARTKERKIVKHQREKAESAGDILNN